jgi:hypothetical protein
VNTAGRGMQIYTFIVGPVNIQIGSKFYKTKLCVAPIGDDMLPGLNCMVTYNVTVDMGRSKFIIGGNEFHLNSDINSIILVVARVSIPQGTVIPPNTVVHVNGQLDTEMENYIVEQCNCALPVLVSRCYYKDQDQPRLCLANTIYRSFTIKRDTIVAISETVTEIQPEVEVQTVRTTTDDKIQEELPDKVETLWQNSSEYLNQDERVQLRQLLHKYRDIFSKDEFDIGKCQGVEHTIDTGEAQPIKQRMRRTPLHFVNDENEQLMKMLQAGVIEPSISECASPPVLIRKSDGKVRYAIDYRKLNSVTKKDVYPLPLIEDCLDTLSGKERFSKLDANNAYYQMSVKSEHRPKTAFITKYGLFHFTRMSFGLCKAPSTYARAMDLVLRGLNWQIVLAFWMTF